MVNKQKRKGSDWERLAVELLNKLKGGKFKRVVGSGMIGTLMGEPLLTADIRGEVEGIPRNLKIECKKGYGDGQMAMKKAWLDKIKEEADNAFSLPLLFGSFSGARSGVKHFIVIDYDTFALIMNLITDMSKELDKAYGEKD